MDKKCVIVLDQDLPVGLLANSSAVLALTLGKIVDGILGHDIQDEFYGLKKIALKN